MIREHFKTFVWLRWRLKANQFKKAGTVNLVFSVIVSVLVVVSAVGVFFTGLFVGWLALPRATPIVRLIVWDGLVVMFIFAWLVGLLAELQRAEALALDKFLHLPVSVSGAFVVNYVSSLFSVTLMVFLPAAGGLLLGQLIAHGPAMLLAFVLLAAFVFALTAVTYQFQGWLASLMSNPRRRRTIIVVATLSVIVLAQAPNLVNLTVRPWARADDQLARNQEQQKALISLAGEFREKKITPEEYQKRQKEIQDAHKAREEELSRDRWDSVERTTRLINAVLPPGWLAIGAAGLADNEFVPALLGILGFGLIGTASLWRAYRTTIKLYTGQFSTGERRTSTPAESAAAAAADADPTRVRFLERQLPRVSEHASAVALAGFRSLMRAPEAKMSLLAPVIMIVVFAGIAVSNDSGPPEIVRPLMAFGVAGMVLLIAGAQLIGNQFGYDRSGFRAYVLSPVPRREILLGKNLAVAPLAVGMGAVLLLIVGIAYPMRIDHYPAALAQLVSAYLVFVMLANVLSIVAPMPMKPGSMQAAQVKLVPILLQMVFLMVLPLAMIPVLVPYGVEVLLDRLDVVRGVPISLPLSLLLLALVVWVYRKVLTVEGEWLWAREQTVLEVVTTKAE